MSKKRTDTLEAISNERIDFNDTPKLDMESWGNAKWVEPDKPQSLTILKADGSI
ncbi:hypothetical protein [Nitrospira sp. M1]